MRSEGNVYYPVPERVPSVRDADEFQRMRARYEKLNNSICRLLICLELQSLLAILDYTGHFS